MKESNSLPPNSESLSPIVLWELPDFTLNGYQVLEELATHDDGSRVTYLAKEIAADRLVIIKQWRAINADSLVLDYGTYRSEIERLQHIQYPNIPRYLTSFPTATGFCLVRAYQPGIPLSEVGTLPPSDIKLIANSVLRTLDYLQHLHPIFIHQNLKPENIIVDTTERLKVYLVDFGLYCPGHPPGILAAPGFRSPEQLFNRQITAASDVYSLGITLICLLTGTKTAKAEQLLDREYCPQFKHLLATNSHPKFIAWLAKMVEPNYQRRYRDAASARDPIQGLPLVQSNLFSTIGPIDKKNWLLWSCGTIVIVGLGLFLRQIILPNIEELSPEQIARNQAIGNQAKFEGSDRGKLLKDKSCIGCNLDYQNFANADLAGASLHQSSLNSSNFVGANLTLAIFRDADLSRANFSKANLHQAAFYGAKLMSTDLSGANLSEAKLVYADLKGSRLRNVNLTNADLKFAELQQVDLNNANLSGADLSNADLSYTNLRRAKLTGAKLIGTKLTGATMPDGSLHQ